jgi:hypothetical protein
MEKNKKVLKNYVVCYGGSRNELDEVEGVRVRGVLRSI